MKGLWRMLALAVLVGAWGCKANESGTTASSEGTANTGTTAAPATPGVKAGTVTLPSGLQYEDLVQGDGPVAETGTQVSVHYTGWLTDGTKFDSSLDSGQPITFQIGTGSIIQGWNEGIRGMKVGGKRKLTIPPHLGYGAGGRPPIPPNATLLFEVELVAVN